MKTRGYSAALSRRSNTILSLAVATVVAGAAGKARSQVLVTQTSSTNWTITNNALTVVFNPTSEDVTSIQMGVGAGAGPNLLGGSKPQLDQEFAGTPFQANAAMETFNESLSATGAYADVWTDVPTGGTKNNPIDYQFHYLVFNNDPTVYCYEVLNHAATDPATSVGQGQFLFRSDPSLFPNLYQVATGPNNLAPQITTGIPSTDPNFASVIAQKGRTVSNVTYDLTGSGIAGDNGTNFFTKYDYSTYTQFYQSETMYGPNYAVSMVVPSTETMTGGPTKQELAWTDPGIMNMEFLSDHYGIDGPGAGPYPGYAYYPTQGVSTSRLFGPFGFTVASTTNGATAAQINQNAINSIPTMQAEFNTDAELAESGYVKSTARGQVQVNAANPAGWDPNPVNNTVVLSQPGVNMQESTQGNQYWGQISQNGNATITGVAPGTYRMTLYQTGQWGETRLDGVQVQGGRIDTPANLKFTPENFGVAPPIWTIGTPNRSANEFMNGHTATGADLRQFGAAYDFWAEEAAMGTPGYVSYYATAEPNNGVSTPSLPGQWIGNQWYTFNPGEYDSVNSTSDNYSNTAPAYVRDAAHGGTGPGPALFHGSPWQVHFEVTPTQQAQGQYVVLSVGLVDQRASLVISLNGNSETWSYNNFAPDDPAQRSGDAAFYQWAAVEFPVTDLNAAGLDNVFTFSPTAHTDGVMYDALRMEITNTSANPLVTGWDDYNYVTTATLNQNDSAALPAFNSFSTIPEPTCIALLAGLAMPLLRPRRRNSRRISL